MASYLLIESRDPFDTNDAHYFHELASQLVRAENRVTLFLVQNGVLPARAGEHARALTELARAGVEVLADDFSLRERGIAAARLAEGVKPASLEAVIDLLAAGHKALWH